MTAGPGRSDAGSDTVLRVQIEEAARVISPLWPLSTFIAVNPFWDLRQLPFDTALAEAAAVLGTDAYPDEDHFAAASRAGRLTPADIDAARESPGGAAAPVALDPPLISAGVRFDATAGTAVAPWVDARVGRWCAGYLAGTFGQGSTDFFTAWRQRARGDRSVQRKVGPGGLEFLDTLPVQPTAAIRLALRRLGIREAETEELTAQLARLPGWAGHAKWRTLWAPPDQPDPAIRLDTYLAVRLCAEAAAIVGTSESTGHRVALHSGSTDPDAPPAGRTSGAGGQDARILLRAYEGHYRDELLADITRPATAPQSGVEAQVVCCIDVRSEGLRRQLESVGPYETLGFAGFFGLPMRLWGWGDAEAVDLCPVLVSPTTELTEVVGGDHAREGRRAMAARQSRYAAAVSLHEARDTTGAPFVLAEAGGYVAAPVALAKTLAPRAYAWLTGRVGRKLGRPGSSEIDVTERALGEADQALYARTALTTMGLVRDFAPLVVLVGHGASSQNNPHASSLDCGACGGNRGAHSARAAAAILNRPAVRRLLGESGIEIPDSTWFCAAEHDTATDRVELLDEHLVPDSHRNRFERVIRDLSRAGDQLAEERLAGFPAAGRVGRRHVTSRAGDWAQVQPEWGLAGCAAFIVGPRAMTRGLDLGRRCFLHSYDAAVDDDGVALETILTAPMVVAHWISSQYYFSTVDPERLGAGDKVAHNVVAGVGVSLGPDPDLRVGLPVQSCFDFRGAVHEPMRLLTVVEAPPDLLESVIGRNTVLQELFDGEWVHLAVRAGPDHPFSLRLPGGRYRPWTPASRASEPPGAQCTKVWTMDDTEVRHGA